MKMTYEVEGRDIDPGVGANECAEAATNGHCLPITKNQLWIAVWKAYAQGRADEQATWKAADDAAWKLKAAEIRAGGGAP